MKSLFKIKSDLFLGIQRLNTLKYFKIFKTFHVKCVKKIPVYLLFLFIGAIFFWSFHVPYFKGNKASCKKDWIEFY